MAPELRTKKVKLNCGHERAPRARVLTPRWALFVPTAFDSILVKTMVTSEGPPPQQQVAVVALVGILAFVFLVGGFLLYRFRRSSYGQNAKEAQVRNLQ